MQKFFSLQNTKRIKKTKRKPKRQELFLFLAYKKKITEFYLVINKFACVCVYVYCPIRKAKKSILHIFKNF